MPFNDIERMRAKRAVRAFMERRRPPPHIRPQLDMGYRIGDGTVELFTVRKEGAPRRCEEWAIARATFDPQRGAWKVSWMRSDSRWYGYDPEPRVGSIQRFLDVVDEDLYGCFFG